MRNQLRLRLRPAVIAFAATLAAVASPLATPLDPAAADADASCHGRAATLVGSPGQRLVGTTGDDVIVSSGARAVRAGSGDDLICVTGAEGTFVTDGRGEDVVDTRGVADASATYFLTRLGPGSDLYLGGRIRDNVEIHAGESDRDVIRTHGGHDVVRANNRGGPSEAVIVLGRGHDYVALYSAVTAVELRGGTGGDRIRFECPWCDITAELGQHRLVYDGVEAAPFGFEKVDFWARQAIVKGGPADNRLEVRACTGSVDGGRGDDRLYLTALSGCPETVPMYGRAGDDRLRGDRGDDLLDGGAGRDTAIGRSGEDTCVAERRFDCEL